MNNVAGAKKSTIADAASGFTKSTADNKLKMLNIPKRALGKRIAAAVNAFLSSLSTARNVPRDSAK